MKNLIINLSFGSMVIGGLLTIKGVLSLKYEDLAPLGEAIAGSIIFGASLIALTLLVRNQNN